MIKEYMIGTLDDMPLLKVMFNDKLYFVDQSKGEVFIDEPKLPRVTDDETIKAVLSKAVEAA